MLASATTKAPGPKRHAGFVLAWGFCLLFYFSQYALRSAPGVMIPELTSTFGLTTLGISSMIGFYYYTYSTFAIVAGAALDRLGARCGCRPPVAGRRVRLRQEECQVDRFQDRARHAGRPGHGVSENSDARRKDLLGIRRQLEK